MVYVKPKALLEKQAAMKGRLLAITLQLIARNGLYSGSLINAAAKRAKVSVGLVYKHFADVDDLIAQALALATQRDLKRVREAWGVKSQPNAALSLARALMVIYGLHASARMRATLAADRNWHEAMTAELAELIVDAAPLSPKQAAAPATAALGAVLAVADVGQRSKNNALAAALFVLRGVGISDSLVEAVMMEMRSKAARYSIDA